MLFTKQTNRVLNAFAAVALALLLFSFALLSSAGAATVAISYPKTLTVAVGATATLTVTQADVPVAATFTSLNPKIATVDAQGIVTGVKKGTTAIVIKVGRKKMTTSVKVIAPPPTPTPPPTVAPIPVASSSLIPSGIPGFFLSEGNMLDMINAERTKEGLKALTDCPELKEAANLRAYEISQRFEHTRPDGTPSVDLIKKVAPKYGCQNENIAKRLGPGATEPSYIIGLWMNSAGHKKNILRPQHTKAAIGVYQGPEGRVYWAVLFVGPKW